MGRLPLAGKKIVVTRPREQAAQLALGIERAGGIPVLFPLLDITPVHDAALKEQVSRLAQFDLAVFVSPSAVSHGMAAIRAAGRVPERLRFAAVGQGSANALRALGIADIIAPAERFDSESLLAEAELGDVHGWRVMIFRGNGGRELLGDTLAVRGAQVEYATCYLRAKPRLDINELLGANADALTATSSEALAYLWDMLDDGARSRLAALPLFVPHERIAAAARSLGWRNVQATEGGEAGLLAGLLAWGSRDS